MEWNILSDDKAHAFIDQVKDDRHPALFNKEFLQVQYYPLTFYKNAYIYVLENLSVAPPFQLIYLKSEETIVYVDGSSAPFDELNRRGHLVLTESNVVDYLQLYCAYVIQRPNNVLLFKNPEQMPFYGDYYVDFHFDKNNYTEKDIKVRKNEEKNGYIINSPFVFDGKIDPATAFISDLGDVQIQRREGR